jgi:hypothetical protein
MSVDCPVLFGVHGDVRCRVLALLVVPCAAPGCFVVLVHTTRTGGCEIGHLLGMRTVRREIERTVSGGLASKVVIGGVINGRHVVVIVDVQYLLTNVTGHIYSVCRWRYDANMTYR